MKGVKSGVLVTTSLCRQVRCSLLYNEESSDSTLNERWGGVVDGRDVTYELFDYSHCRLF